MLFLVLSRFKFSEVALWFSQNYSLRKRTLLWFNEALFLGHVTKATHSNTPAAQREAEENDAGIGFFLGSVVLAMSWKWIGEWWDDSTDGGHISPT